MAPPPRGGGWGGAGADDRDPFAEDNARKQEVDALFQTENTGINFDAYDDIPVRPRLLVRPRRAYFRVTWLNRLQEAAGAVHLSLG